MTGDVNGIGDGYFGNSEYFADLNTMQNLDLVGTLGVTYPIKSQAPSPLNWMTQNLDHRAEMAPVEDEMLFRDVEAMPDTWDQAVWEGFLEEKGFQVRWQGKDSEGRDIAFENFQLSMVEKDAVMTGKGYIGTIGKPTVTSEGFTIIYANGTFQSGNEWTLKLIYHENGEVKPTTIKGKFLIEEGTNWKNSKIKLVGDSPDEKFSLEMVDQRRWYNYYLGTNIPTFTVVTKDGISGIGQGILGWLGPQNYFMFKGIRKGNKLNWVYTFLGPGMNDCQFMYSGDALWNQDYCIIEGRVKQLGDDPWDGPFEYITPNGLDGNGNYVDTAEFIWNDGYCIEMNVPPKD